MRQPRSRMLQIAMLLALLVTVAGCATQWSYRLLDWYVSGQLRDYLPLDSDQRADFEQRLETVLRWHRGTQLPLYSDWLRSLDEMVAADRVTFEQWRAQGERMGEFWQSLMRRVQPQAAAVLRQLSDEQTAEFLANLEQRTVELADEYRARDVAQRRQHRARRMEKSVKRWLGSLRPEQSERIEQWSKTVEDLSELSLASRRRWTAAMATALLANEQSDGPPGQQLHSQPGEMAAGLPPQPRSDDHAPGRGSISATERLIHELEPLLVDPSRLWTPAYQAAIEHNTSETIRLLSDLHAMSDAEQRRHLHDALRSWSERLDRLAAEA